ncbi:unnamed protein product [Oppiella nova]|uniref:Nuclear receptor domain-containing protein n=1 Tax=Oppiella nova TaxID=334625 RepID=A0A7R9MGK8_9ACAR|nr:unnamed protein product [Oppiella nova]CAG2176838.1 unnamed protein product [Oppiella nova]
MQNKNESKCQICGDNSCSYHFDAMTCSSCKAFFRRNALIKVDQFKCYLGVGMRTVSKNI